MAVGHCSKHSKFIPGCVNCKIERDKYYKERKAILRKQKLDEDDRFKIIVINNVFADKDLKTAFEDMYIKNYEFITQINFPVNRVYLVFERKK